MSQGGSSGGGGMGGGMITNIASSVANVGAGWFANDRLNKGTDEALGQQDQANALYQNLYGKTQGDYAKYQGGGERGFDALLRTYGIGAGQTGGPDYSGFENSPDYQFQVQEGAKLRQNQAAGNGRLYSGAYDKELTQFGQGLAYQNLDDYRRGLYNISNTGLGATNALAQYRQGYGNQLGQGYENKGDLMYARRIGQANINYRNVAAQDSIWGSGSGGGQPQQNGNSLSTYGDGSGNGWNSNGSYDYGSTANNFNWGGG